MIGVSAARADIPTFAGWLTAPLLFGGSAQVVVIDLLDAGAAPVVIVLAALAVNLRLVLYSATMAPRWRGTPIRFQALAAYLLVDPTLAVGVDGYERSTDPDQGHRHYLGGAVALWVAWLAAVAVGATVGARLPEALHLELVVPLFLAGEVATRVHDPGRCPRGRRRGGRRRGPVPGAAAPGAGAGDRGGHRRGPARRGCRRDPTMSAWIVVALAGAGSYLFRISMLVVAAHAGVPAVIERSARFAVPIAFAALAATSLAGLVARHGDRRRRSRPSRRSSVSSSPGARARPAPPSSSACRPCGC